MACVNSTATNVKQLLQEITAFLIDSNNFTGGNAWQLLRPQTLDQNTTEVILKGVGDGQDEIFVGMKIKADGNDQENILLNGFAGYDPNLDWYEQPGAIPEIYPLPCVPLAKDVFITYWLTANTSRFMFIVEMSTQYEGAYLGFFKPIAIERQYPYPLMIGGSAVDGIKWTNKGAGHSLFTNPGSNEFGGLGDYKADEPSESRAEHTSSLCIRRPDGNWRSAINKNSSNRAMKFERLCVWPTNTEPVDTFTVYKPEGQTSQFEDNMFHSFLLYETYPTGIIGEMDGIYFIGNRTDLSSNDSVQYKDKIYKVFSNVHRRDDDQYFAMFWG